jgi:ADP-ribose pyrophosphatase YjhB (NUDIX family)
MELRVRPTGILIEDNRLLVVKQWVTPTRGWSLPGGRLESEETIEQCLVREFKEETGLDIKAGELLYITDRFFQDHLHIVHMTFLVTRTGAKPDGYAWIYDDPQPIKTAGKTREVKMVPLDEITQLGFTSVFLEMIKDNFPGRGSYRGDYYTFYGEMLL